MNGNNQTSECMHIERNIQIIKEYKVDFRSNYKFDKNFHVNKLKYCASERFAVNEKRGKNNTWDFLKLEKVVIVSVKFKTELVFQPNH